VRELGPLLWLAAAACHDHGHGHGHEREREELPAEVTAENSAAVVEQSLRRINGASVGGDSILVPWRADVEGRPVLVGIERRSTRGGPDVPVARMEFRKLRKVGLTPPAQGGLGLWGLALEGETSVPFTIWSADGPSVKALAASVERLRNPAR
jgi:hypothetical protein